MKLGFTGTRNGMSAAQIIAFRLLVASRDISEFAHGSCRGADVQAAQIVRELQPAARIICHPGPDGDTHRDASNVDDETLAPQTHFARNRAIVAATDELVATPCDMTEQAFGGTWFTVRHAMKTHKRVTIIWPDGKVEVRR